MGNLDISINHQHKNDLHRLYLLYSWGAEQKSDYRAEAERLISTLHDCGLFAEAEEAILQGSKAFNLSKQLETQLNGQGLQAAKSWLENILKDQEFNIKISLKKYLEKWKIRQNQIKERKSQKVFYSTIKPIQVEDFHPNSIQHLNMDSNWSIYIDESGQYFDRYQNNLTDKSSELGRIVALVVPSRTQLNPLSKGFHATELSALDVDNCVEYLLNQDLGIFGFTVNDPIALAGNWFSHVVLLIRWVLLQLPIEKDEKTKVSIFIERNDARLAYQSIDSLANLLEDELKALDYERFDGISICAKLIDKTHALNGYVDAIAYTWGSPSAHSKDRLKKSALLGHCLLLPDQQAMQRFYIAAAKGQQLSSQDWFNLCSIVTKEHKKSFLVRILENLGVNTSKNLRSWEYYLDEVKERLRSKNYNLAEISNALNWLEKYSPEGYELPDIYRLSLETTRLSQENHQGKVNLQRLEKCLTLMNTLEEEDAQQVCGALLRVAVSASNSFEFKLLQPMISQWLDKSISISGLANYARLHSTMGQIHAFLNETSEAINHFEKALHFFDRLSDKKRANREKAQTNSYRLTVLMDSTSICIPDFLDELACTSNWDDYSITMATSGSIYRYQQYLWLRALITYPSQTKEARQRYLKQIHLWQIGTDHPWGVISAYRAWLLKMEGENIKASKQMSFAINLCANEDNGPILWWMAEVFRTIATALDISIDTKPSKAERARLVNLLPAVPINGLELFLERKQFNHNDIINILKTSLPFNFH